MRSTARPFGVKIAAHLSRSVTMRRLTSRFDAFREELLVDTSRHRGIVLGEGARVPVGSVLTSTTTVATGTAFTGPVFVEGPGQVDIGPWCTVGYGLRIITTAHNVDVVNMHMPLQDQLGLPSFYGARGPVEVGGACWIGDGVTILGRVTIGPGAVIGAGSVVANDVRPFAVVVGNPARELRRRFDDDVAEFLMETRWWDWPMDRILRNSALFACAPGEGTVDDLRRLMVD